jgi:hypothetical protein
MRRLVRTALSGAAVTCIALGGLLLTATPASAAAPGQLPAGDTLFALDCDGETVSTYQFTDVATATTVPVGEANDLDSDCAGPAAYDYSTGTAYFISWGEDGELATLNWSTGGAAAAALLTISDDPETDVYPDGIAIGLDGAAYITFNTNLYSLNKTTGVMTLIGSTGVDDLYGFAVHPATGVFYAINEDGIVYVVDVTDASLDELATLELDYEGDGPSTNIYALQIDRDGVFWIQNYGIYSDLWSARLDDLANTETFWGVIHYDADTVFDTESILLVPGAAPTADPVKPALAETGVAQSPALWVGGAAVLLLGSALVVFRAVKRRA